MKYSNVGVRNVKNIELVLLGIFLFSLFRGNKVQIVFFLLFFLSTLLKTSRFKMSITKNGYFIFSTLFLGWIIISLLWLNKNYMDKIVVIYIFILQSEIFFTFNWMSRYVKKIDSLEDILKVYIFAAFMLTIFLLSVTTMQDWIGGKVGQNVNINRNTAGIFFALATSICVYFATNGKKKIYTLCAVVFATITFLTGSRKAIITLVGVVTLYLLLSEKGKKAIRNICFIILFLVVVLFLIFQVDFLYEIIGYRIENLLVNTFIDNTHTDKSIWERAFFRKSAIFLFMNKPITGHGVDGFRAYMSEIGYNHVAYSHCNYTEILANFGIIGFVLYYVPRLWAILLVFKKKMFKKSKLIAYLLSVVIVLMLIEYGLVSYYAFEFQLFFVLFFILVAFESKNDEKG